MKKPSFFTKIVASTAICALFASSVSAMSAVGNVEVPRGTPTIDGKISDGEWDGAGVVNFSSATAKAWVGAVPGDFNTDVKVFWDEKGLYLAGEVVDSTFVASNEGSYDGDAFQVSIDLGQTFYDTDNNRAIFYSFGCNETNRLHIDRQNHQRLEFRADARMVDPQRRPSGKGGNYRQYHQRHKNQHDDVLPRSWNRWTDY